MNPTPRASIETVLQQLGAAQPSPSMQQRILARLAQEEPAAPRKLWQQTRAWPFALATAAAAILCWSYVDHHQQTQPAPTTTASATTLQTGASPATRQRNLVAASSFPSRPSEGSEVSRNFAARPRLANLPTPHPPTAISAADQLALAETLAPSRPAMPSPLTATERTLLRGVASEQLVQLADLRPTRESTLRSAIEARRIEALTIEARTIEARRNETRAVTHYIAQLLAPLAASESLQPGSAPQPDEAATPPSPLDPQQN